MDIHKKFNHGNIIIRGIGFILALVFLTFIYYINEVNLDSVNRFNASRIINIQELNIKSILFEEIAPLIISYFLNDPETLQYLLLIIAILSFQYAWNYNAVWLIFFVVTPFGYLLLFNIQPFFIAVCLFYFVVNLYDKAHYKLGIMVFLAATSFHWITLFLIGVEALVRINYKIRSILIFVFFSIIFALLIYIFGVLALIEAKLSAYDGSSSNNPLHAHFTIFLTFIAFTLKSFFDKNKLFLARLIVISVFVITLLLIDQLKAASRLAFISDIFIFILFVNLTEKFFAIIKVEFKNEVQH